MNLDLPSVAEAEAWLADLSGGAIWRDALERHLVRCEAVRAERTMQLLKEGRGAWLPAILESNRPAGGEAWFFGNALSGTSIPLARLGFAVRCFDADERRAEIARLRDRWLADGNARFESWTPDHDLPSGPPPRIAIVEGPLVGARGRGAALVRELHERGAEQVVWIADNRFGYKRSTGVRADLRVQTPLRFLRAALGRGERTLRGYRQVLARDGASRALALYPHRWDFSLVVGLDGGGPGLFLGPGERANKLKMLARRIGLFPWLTPSFAVAAPPPQRSLAQHWLDRLEEEIDESPGRIEHLVATRGSNVLMLTQGRRDEGRWAVRVPMGPDQERQTRRHGAFIERLQRRGFKVPTLLYSGTIDGTFVQVERRIDGVNAAQLVHERDRVERTLPGCDAILADARVTAAVDLAPHELETLVTERAEVTARRAARADTAAALRELGRRCAEALRGTAVPRVVAHGDLRAKHVQVAADGTPLALLDFGCASDRDLPYVDLLNLVLHDRKDDAGTDLGAAWREAKSRTLPEPLERVLAAHAQRLALPQSYTSAIREAYPLFVGHSAEAAWDYSRPCWIHRQLGI